MRVFVKGLGWTESDDFNPETGRLECVCPDCGRRWLGSESPVKVLESYYSELGGRPAPISCSQCSYEDKDQDD